MTAGSGPRREPGLGAYQSAPDDTVSSLLSDVVAGLARLVRGEVALAKAEARRSLTDAAQALVKLALGLVLGLVGINVLAGAAVAGLVGAGLQPVWAGVIVGGILLALAFGFVQAAQFLLRPSNLAPRRVARNLERDLEVLQGAKSPAQP